MEMKRTAKLAVVVAAALAVGVLIVSGAQAVHDTGRFQLDGDASSATQPPPPATRGSRIFSTGRKCAQR